MNRHWIQVHKVLWELGMSNKFKLLWIVCSGLVVSPAAMAVDLVGVHDRALKSDPRLQAAEYRRQATAENKAQARANLLPQLGANGNWSKGNRQISLAGTEITDDTTATRSYGLTLQQSLALNVWPHHNLPAIQRN